MAKLSSYTKDTSITEKDKLAGSSYVGLINGVPKYQTASYTIEDLGTYFSENITVGGQVYDIETIYNDLERTKTYTLGLQESFWSANEDGSLNTLSVAFANQVFSVTTSAKFATSQYVTNLGTSFGEFDASGNLVSLAEAFANQVFTTTTSSKFATSQYVSNLGSSVGTLNEDGTLASLSEAFANSVITTTTSDKFAESTRVNTLGATLGVYDANGDTIIASNAAYLGSVTTYVDENSATASKVEELNSTLNLLDENGNAIYTNAQYLQSITTHVDENSATAGKVTNLGAAFGTFDGETFSISEAKITEELNTYTGLNFSESAYFQNIESNISGKPSVYRQDGEPTISAGPPQEPANGSIWYDTNDSNKVYILAAGAWTLTDDSRVGATASKVTNMSAAFGTFDENNNFTIDGDASYGEAIVVKVDTDSATASKVTNLNSVLNILDESGNATVTNADYLNSITTYVDENSATAEKAETLRVAIEGQDGTGGLTAELTETSEALAVKPNVYRQDEPPTGTIPVKSVWYDTNDNNKPYIYDGNPAEWVEARDGKVVELESYARAQKTIEADANGVITGITIKSENSGDPETAISDITFKTSTFNIVNQSDVAKLSFDGTNLSIDGSGTFAGTITGSAGVFGTVTIDSDGISSSNFTIDDFGNVSVSGDISGSSGTFGAVTIDSSGISSDNFNIDDLGNVSIAGDITGSSGEFNGTFNTGGVEIDGSELTLSANVVGGSWVGAPVINFYDGPTAVDGVVLAGSITSDYVLSKDEALLNVEARDTLYLTAPEVIISGQLTIEGGLISADVTLDSVTTSGNTTTNDISVNNIYTDAVLLDTVYPETATTPGIVTWNIAKSTAVVRVNATLDYRIGQQTFFYGKATEAISKGDVVMFAGVQGSFVLIAKADMAATGFIPEYVIGVAAEDFLINQFGHVIEFGELIGFDTTAFQDGDLLYLDPATPGGYVTTEPHASVGHSILIAAVINTQNSTNGGIIVRPTHKAGLNELHGVNTSGLTGGQTLAYNDVEEEWETRDIYHIHYQGIASDTWVITHNLKKYPSVTIVDSLDNVVIGDINYTNINTVTLTFNGGFSGKAYLN